MALGVEEVESKASPFTASCVRRLLAFERKLCSTRKVPQMFLNFGNEKNIPQFVEMRSKIECAGACFDFFFVVWGKSFRSSVVDITSTRVNHFSFAGIIQRKKRKKNVKIEISGEERKFYLQ
jgi:hypothetical protein